jgi:hypothetical protein
MKRSVLFTLAILAAAGRAVAAAPPQPFEFDAKFEPAFHARSQLTLRSSGESAKLIIKIADTSTSLPVDGSVAAEFLREATSLRFTKNKQEEGLDGCDVKLHLNVGGKEVFAGSVWSPTKASAPTEDALLRALHKVTEHSRVPSPQADYLEDLYGYFDGIQPRWKVLDGNPFTVRFYARLSSDDIPAFRSLVASLPRDRETMFDITNLESTGTLFYDEFLKATKKRGVKWRAGKGWSEQLIKIGVPKDRIIPPKA